jgi:hypothetical protein
LFKMDLSRILTALRLEHKRISDAILTIERLTKVHAGPESPARRRGRPLGSKNRPKDRSNASPDS